MSWEIWYRGTSPLWSECGEGRFLCDAARSADTVCGSINSKCCTVHVQQTKTMLLALLVTYYRVNSMWHILIQNITLVTIRWHHIVLLLCGQIIQRTKIIHRKGAAAAVKSKSWHYVTSVAEKPSGTNWNWSRRFILEQKRKKWKNVVKN